MWMWGPVGAGFWWIFPLIGLVMCVLMMVMMGRVAGGRGGCMGMMGMGGRNRPRDDDAAAMRQDIDTLRDEIRQLKASR